MKRPRTPPHETPVANQNLVSTGPPMFKTLKFARRLSAIRNRFELLEKCGEGAFSAVFRARPRADAGSGNSGENRSCLAIKVISHCCDLQRTGTEILLLQALKGQPNVISLVTAVREADTVLIVMDYVEHRPFVEFYRQLKPSQVRHYMRCLLDALRHVHSLKIVHRDVKPNNALYNPATGRFALADFGLAHPVQSPLGRPAVGVAGHRNAGSIVFSASRLSTSASAAACRCSPGLVCGACVKRRPIRAPRGGTNGYRPPEVLLQADLQDCQVDTWAAGCILAAFLSGRQPFLSCRSDSECLYLLCCLFGIQSMKASAAAVSRELSVLPVVDDSLPDSEFPCRRARLAEICRRSRRSDLNCDPDVGPESAFDLLSGLLQADPAKRMTAEEALKHPFLAQP